jgi:hypothetical protein
MSKELDVNGMGFWKALALVLITLKLTNTAEIGWPAIIFALIIAVIFG